MRESVRDADFAGALECFELCLGRWLGKLWLKLQAVCPAIAFGSLLRWLVSREREPVNREIAFTWTVMNSRSRVATASADP